jgi:hypothetical protein
MMDIANVVTVTFLILFFAVVVVVIFKNWKNRQNEETPRRGFEVLPPKEK